MLKGLGVFFFLKELLLFGTFTIYTRENTTTQIKLEKDPKKLQSKTNREARSVGRRSRVLAGGGPKP